MGWACLREQSGESKDGKKSSQGRVQKWIGDLCLLSGTPQDAIECYVQAITDNKVSQGRAGPGPA